MQYFRIFLSFSLHCNGNCFTTEHWVQQPYIIVVIIIIRLGRRDRCNCIYLYTASIFIKITRNVDKNVGSNTDLICLIFSLSFLVVMYIKALYATVLTITLTELKASCFNKRFKVIFSQRFVFCNNKKRAQMEVQDRYNEDRQGPIAAMTVIINIFRS